MSAPLQITVSGGNLYDLAMRYLGSAQEWVRIAELNGLTDPMLTGTNTLTIPAANPSLATDGVWGAS